MSWILLARKVCARDTNPSNVLVLWLLLDFVKTNAHPDTHTHDMYRLYTYTAYTYTSMHSCYIHAKTFVCMHAKTPVYIHTHI